MKTVELSAALGQAQVVENLKNFVGVDAQGAAALMTPERLAAVAGGLQFKGMIEKNANLDEITENGTYIIQADHSIFKSGCILYVIKIERYIHHIAFDISGLFIQTRFKGYSGDWYTWMKINLSSLA